MPYFECDGTMNVKLHQLIYVKWNIVALEIIWVNWISYQNVSPLLDRSYMRLTEKENETLPIDVSVFWGMRPFTLFTFDKPVGQKLFIIGWCFGRSYCRHYCRLSWLATGSSTSPESSKIWTPHRNWKTSRFIRGALFHRGDFHPFPLHASCYRQ